MTGRYRTRRERVLALFAEGKTQTEIAAAIGVSQATVSRLLHAAGVAVPRGKAADRRWRRRRGLIS